MGRAWVKRVAASGVCSCGGTGPEGQGWEQWRLRRGNRQAGGGLALGTGPLTHLVTNWLPAGGQEHPGAMWLGMGLALPQSQHVGGPDQAVWGSAGLEAEGLHGGDGAVGLVRGAVAQAQPEFWRIHTELGRPAGFVLAGSRRSTGRGRGRPGDRAGPPQEPASAFSAQCCWPWP